MRDAINHRLVDLLLCAADHARMGCSAPITQTCDDLQIPLDAVVAIEARWEAKAVSTMVFEFRNDLLADCLLEAAYRVAERKGVGGPA